MSVFKKITSTKSLTIPTFTTIERDALSDSNNGNIIFNSTTGILNTYSDGWLEIGDHTFNLLSFELDSTETTPIGKAITATLIFDNFIKENIETGWFTPEATAITYYANKAIVEFIPTASHPTFNPSINDGTVFTVLTDDDIVTVTPAQITINSVSVTDSLNIVSFITNSETISEGEPLELVLTFNKSVGSVNITDFSPNADSVTSGPSSTFTITYNSPNVIGVATKTIPIGQVFAPESGANLTTESVWADDTTVVADLTLTTFAMAKSVVQQGEPINAILTFNKNITGSIDNAGFNPNAISVVLSTNKATASLDTSIGPLAVATGYTGSVDVGFDVSPSDGTLAYGVAIQNTPDTYEVKDLTVSSFAWASGIGSKGGTQDLVITFNHAVDAATLGVADFNFGAGSFVSASPLSGDVTAITLSVQLPSSIGAYSVDLTGTIGYEGTQKTFSIAQTSGDITVTELSATFAFVSATGGTNSNEPGVLTFNMPVLTASVEVGDFDQIAVNPIVASVGDTVFTLDFTLPAVDGTHTVNVNGSFSPADGGTPGVLLVPPSDSITVDSVLIFAFNGKDPATVGTVAVVNSGVDDTITSLTTGSNVFDAVNTTGAATTGQLVLNDVGGSYSEIVGNGDAGLQLKLGLPSSTDTEYGYTVYMYILSGGATGYISSFCDNVDGSSGNSDFSIEHRYNNKVHYHDDTSNVQTNYDHTDADVVAYRVARSATTSLRGVHIWRNTTAGVNVKTQNTTEPSEISNGAISIGGKVDYQTTGNVLAGEYGDTYTIREFYVYKAVHTDAEIEAKLETIRTNWTGII